MFKFLKKVLFGAEKELEKKLEDQLEDELAREKEKAAKAPAAPAAAPSAPSTLPPSQHITPGVQDIPPQPLNAKPPAPPAGTKEKLSHSPPVSKERPASPPERLIPT